jgi:uncharacterized membrane protein
MVRKANFFDLILPKEKHLTALRSSHQGSLIPSSLASSKWLLLMIAIYSTVMSYVVLLRYYAFQTHAFDLGIFNQAFSTALQGRLFYETPDQYLIPSGSFLGVHFNLLMFLLLPIYALFPHPQTLLLLQTGVVALGAVPIYLVTRRIVGTEKLALVMASVYLVNPAIINLNLYDFHLEAFLPFFLGMFFYCYIAGNWRGYAVFLALSLVTIEFASLLVVAICLAHAFRTLSRRSKYHLPVSFGIEKSRALILLSTIAISLVVFYLILYASLAISGKPVSVQGSLSIFVSTQNAQLFLAKSEFWMLCLIPLMFLPFLAPSQLMMIAPWFFVTLLEGAYATSYSFGYQNAGAFVVPYLILATIFAVEKLRRHRTQLRSFFIGIFLFSLFISPFNPLMQNRIPGIAYQQGFPIVTAHDHVLDAAIGLIPPNASVLTQNNLFPQVSNRADSFLYVPSANTSIEYVLADSTASTYTVGISASQTMKEFLPYFLSTGEYGIVVNDDGVLLLKANYTGPVLLGGSTEYTFNYQTLDLGAGSRQSDPTSVSGTVLVHTSSDPSGGTFWFGPYASLPPGRYDVTFALKSAPTTNGSLYLDVDNFVNSTSAPILAQQHLTQVSFSSPGSWTNFTLVFNYTPQESATGGLEFRGVDAVGGPFSLDYVEVTYVSPFNA